MLEDVTIESVGFANLYTKDLRLMIRGLMPMKAVFPLFTQGTHKEGTLAMEVGRGVSSSFLCPFLLTESQSCIRQKMTLN